MLENGTKVAGYEIEGVLGHGGMGVVYEARQVALGRKVALKILAGTLGMDPSFKERFRNEGRIQAAVDHPHIVTVFEAGEWEDSLFIAMRLVRGPNLKEMIIARELEGGRTLRILRPIAEALDAAHEAGLIHRDIKPQNILVGARDRAYLADFGLTKGIDDAGLTQTGQFVGTIDYISPEQIRGETTTSACDIYALAAVLYECLTGAVPYAKPSDAAVMYAHLSEPPPLVTEQRPELPPNLDEVICKAMDKDPVSRHPTATAMIDDAEKALGKRVRAVITPPGPIEGPEEAGIREREARVPTRPERLRQPPAPATSAGPTAGAAPAPAPATTKTPTPGDAGPAPAVAATAAAVAPPTVAEPSAPEESASSAAPPAADPAVQPEEPVAEPVPPDEPDAEPVQPEEPVAEPAAPTRAAAAVRREEQDVTPAAPTATTPAVDRDQRTTAPNSEPDKEAGSPPTVRMPAAARRGSSRRQRQPARAPAPAVAGTPPPALPVAERAPARGRSSRFPYAIAAVALVAAAIAGYLIGRPGDEEQPASPRSAAERTLTSSTTAGALGLRFPNDWDRRGEAPKIPGLVLDDQVVIGPTGTEGRGIVAGMAADAGGARLLGPGFLAGLEEPPRAPDRVRLGKVEALRYEGLEPKNFGGRALTVFAAPTSAGVATIACYAPRGEGAAFRSDCERVAGTLEVEGAETFPVGADKKYAAGLNRVLGELGKARRAGRTALAAARTPAAQSKAASGLADATARARAGLRGLETSPAAAPAQARIEQTLARASAAYKQLAQARSTRAFRRATARVTAAEAALQRQLAGLQALGYATG